MGTTNEAKHLRHPAYPNLKRLMFGGLSMKHKTSALASGSIDKAPNPGYESRGVQLFLLYT